MFANTKLHTVNVLKWHKEHNFLLVRAKRNINPTGSRAKRVGGGELNGRWGGGGGRVVKILRYFFI